MNADLTQHQDGLLTSVETRLWAADDLSDEAKYLVLAALQSDSDDDFHAAAQTEPTTPKLTAPRPEAEPAPVRAAQVYLRGIEAQGFRGIGLTAQLDLKPGPGLTLVAGRNGCGKSSFAEAAEVAITGTSHRAATRGSRGAQSWRNLHHKDACRVALKLTEEGAGDTTVQAQWSAQTDDFDQAACWVQRHGKPRDHDRGSLGWISELSLYKPFLSHAELGEQLADGGRSKLYTAINSALGLERIDATVKRLDTLHKDLKQTQTEADRERRALRAEVHTHDDDRAQAVHALLGKTQPDLDTLAGYATGQADDGRVARLRLFSALTSPDPKELEAQARHYRAARQGKDRVESTVDQKDQRRRDLLRTALEHHRDHGPATCPLCGIGELDPAWAERVTLELESADQATQAAELAHTHLRQAEQDLLRLRMPVPAALTEAEDDPLPAVVPALSAWREFALLTSPEHLATETSVDTADLVGLATDELRDAAAQELERVQDAWQPLALRLGRWLEPARRAESMRERVGHAKSAHTWMREHADTIRNERLAPINAGTQKIWNLLRQNSNVTVGPLELRGTGNQRKVRISTAVDGGEDDAGMDVLSQGEMNALALAIFLPRVQLAGSPFGFVMIDDPVQAMDPAKVDGLAQVLADLAETRQVIVFTHDDRLPEAVQRLQIPATILTVRREENSVVTVVESSDPVSRYLAEARVIAADTQIPLEVRSRVVPRLCRDALERRCKELFYRRELLAGASRGEVEDRWQAAWQTKNRIEFVVNRPGEMSLDRWLAGGGHRKLALGAASSAVHEGWSGNDLGVAVQSTERTTRELLSQHG